MNSGIIIRKEVIDVSQEKVNKDKAMAADLKRRGINHGKRTTSTHAPAAPKMSDVGSAAYRRLMDRKRK